MLRTLLALTALLLVATAAGCSDSVSDEEFQTQAREARDRIDVALADMTRATTLDDLLERMRYASDETRAAADELAEGGFPGDVEEEAQELVDALSALADEVSATADALDQGEFEGSSIQGLEFENWERSQAALDALRNEGIDVRPFERY